MPWLNVPKDRETVFVKPPQIPGGLLGGASSTGKMSKLQALAAARKKKADDQKSEEKPRQETRQSDHTPTPPRRPEFATTSSLTDHLDGLQLKENIRPSASTTGETAALKFENANVEGDQMDGTRDTPAKPPAQVEESPSTPAPTETAAPSPFAQALLGPTNNSTTPTPRYFQFPYMNLPSSIADVFSAPSPDDVVLKAQSQGSLLARKEIE